MSTYFESQGPVSAEQGLVHPDAKFLPMPHEDIEISVSGAMAQCPRGPLLIHGLPSGSRRTQRSPTPVPNRKDTSPTFAHHLNSSPD